MRKQFTTWTGLAIVAVIVLAANLIASVALDRAKVDLTEEKLYSLSKGSVNIVRGLEDRIAAKLYYSRSVASDSPQFATYADRLIQMLREYEALSGGKFVLEIIDPKPDTEEEEWAEKYGLQGVAVGPATRLFLGLVMKDESDNERVIPFFSPQRENSLEYDITKALYALNYATTHPNKEKPKVALISSLDLGAGPQNPMMRQAPQQQWLFVRELRSNFTVEEVPTDATDLPEDVDLVLLVHPKNLGEPMQYAIDQYVLGGGKVLAFVDPLSFMDQRNSNPMDMQMRMSQSFSSDMPKLFKAWGIELQNDGPSPGMMGMGAGRKMKIAIDPQLATNVPTEQGYQKHPALLSLTDAQTADEEIVTNQLDNLLMAFPGSIKRITTDDAIRFVPLLTTTEDGATVGDMMFRFGMPDPRQILNDYKPSGSPLTLACKVSGKFKTAFEQGRPVREEDESGKPGAVKYEADEKQIKESASEGTIIVVADVDMLANDLAVRISNIFGQQIYEYVNDNVHLISNAVENLTGSKDLIALRSRGRSSRPFTVVDEIERNAQEKWLSEQKDLEEKIQQATQRLNELKRGGGNDRRILDQAYSAEVRKIRDERARMRGQLRDIRRHLREDVERLGAVVKFVNIAMIPLLVALVSIAIAIIKLMRRRKTA